jgi:orotate phosphoribosyltransferase
MLAIFTYGFPVAEQKFKAAKVKLTTLCNYDSVLSEALSTNYIAAEDIETLQEWRKSPSTWKTE